MTNLRQHVRDGLLAFLALAWGGCVTEPTLAEKSTPTSTPPTNQLARLARQLKLGISKANCSPEVRTLIRLVKHECGVEHCPVEVIENLLKEVDPHERFLWIMRDMPHVVVYLKDLPKGGSVTEAMVLDRQERLKRLLEPPWLDFAQVLIIGHGGAREPQRDWAAQQRADKIKELILGMRHADGQRLSPSQVYSLSYSFPLKRPTAKQLALGPDKPEYLAMLEMLNKNILLEKDMPISGEPSDVAKGVWVFLVDCAAEL